MLLKDFYARFSKKRGRILSAILFLTFLLMLIDLTLGSYDLNLIIFVKNFISQTAGAVEQIVMLKLRFPKTLSCILVGMSLGMSGYYMQAILKNPIASPFTLGISSAASCGAAFSIVTGFPFLHPGINIPLSAVFFSLICTGFMILFTLREKTDAKFMILFGVALNFFFLAFQSLVQYVADEKQIQKIINWIFGSVSKANWTGVIITGITFTLIFVLTYRKAWDLNLLGLSDSRAQSMGLNIKRFRTYIFICSSIVTAVAISYVGTIGFIGLLAPHFSRLLVGSDARYLAPLSALLGGALLTFASVLSKIIIPGALIPIGIITNLVGVPFMAFIALRGREYDIAG